ncbi:FMN-binding negative transcriptional regulator [Pseudoalteromonas phenolica]|uniref:FMN-binding negative transcriptional regulator n=1 Tax=Pseudoalteromonas phenolica TaxID=161398 RepID=UPI00110AC215|nr:FMN-binding negative transcriptional regulator [Pseudoalteromonas phenolica]TMO55905.1 transcriptional regulator [Pseudoalteromonas phenolica]
MHIPKNQKMSDAVAVQFIHDFGFGCLVSDDLVGSHLPFIFNEDSNTLLTHLAKANPHHKILDAKEVLIIFSGPHAYISPSWYEKGPAVPTWNYAAVHVKGRVKLLDGQETMSVVTQTVEKYEADLFNQVDIYNHEFNARLSRAIIGVEIEILSIEGKLKLGQHRSVNDQQGVFDGLYSKDHESQMLAQYMKKINVGIGCIEVS